MTISRYAHCWIKYEPVERGAGCIFVNKIEDDSIIPKKYIESVRQGLEEVMNYGYPITDIKATLYDGSYNEHDSSEMNYKIAASMTVRKMVKEGDVAFLEPIMKLKIQLEYAEFDRIRSLVECNEGKTEDGENENEKFVFIPLRKIIGDAPPELKKLAKQSLSMEVSNYTEVSESLQKDIMNDKNFGNTYYENILEIMIDEEHLENIFSNETQFNDDKLKQNEKDNLFDQISDQLELGENYQELALTENQEENLLKGIEALNLVSDIKKIRPEYSSDYASPFDEKYILAYAEISNNRGKICIELAKLIDKKENLLKASQAFDKALWCYNEALKIKKQKDYPVDYAIIKECIDKTNKLKATL
jgi:tetratricopeptide (TPR) repeat protein